jgi:two-component system sensor histidine kinase and response regulator WspE
MSGQDYSDFSMMDLFRIEAENHTRVLEEGLVDVEADQSPERIEPLMRAAHSLKGAARIVGLDTAVSLAHAMEDLLSAAQHGSHVLNSADIDILLKGNDIFAHLAQISADEIPQALEEQQPNIGALAAQLQSPPADPPVRARPASPPSSPPSSPSSEPFASPATEPPLAAPGAPPPSESPPATPLTAPSQEPPRKDKAASDKGFVRVESESLSRLMGLAGEFLVQSKSVQRFSQDMLKVKSGQRELGSLVEQVLPLLEEPDAGAGLDDRLHELNSKLNLVRDRQAQHIEQFEAFSRHLERLADRLYNEVIASRMRPFGDGVHGFPRMVRDLARQLDRNVGFEIHGRMTPVDRDILEKLEAPLTHLLRNAVDHGMEPPTERLAQGKSEQGRLLLEAEHRGGMLHISIADDGRGIDPEGIRRKVVERGLASESMAEGMTTPELLEFMFLPGFSTAGEVTEISGRGVGLDVVHAMVREVGGHVQVDSTLGQGTVFHLELPLTLSVLRTLLVEINGEPYAVPLNRIERLQVLNGEDVSELEDREYFTWEDEHIGLVNAREVLQFPMPESMGDSMAVLIISDRLNRYGLIVDRFLGQHDLVVIPLDSRLGKIPNINAGAVREDGEPLLILDVEDMVRSIDHLLERQRPARITTRIEEQGRRAARRVLVVDDSLTVREVERKLLENRGYDVAIAVDGQDGWNTLQQGGFDMVITDVDMPRMNGIELVAKIKAVPQLRDLPVMIVSYKDREEDRMRGLQAGADYYLTKSSFNDESLIDAVMDLIGAP